MSAHPYRAATLTAPVAVLERLDARTRLRRFGWFRALLGGRWELHAAALVPGCPEQWHRVGVDPTPLHSVIVCGREVYS